MLESKVAYCGHRCAAIERGTGTAPEQRRCRCDSHRDIPGNKRRVSERQGLPKGVCEGSSYAGKNAVKPVQDVLWNRHCGDGRGAQTERERRGCDGQGQVMNACRGPGVGRDGASEGDKKVGR